MDAFGTTAPIPVAPERKLFSVQEATRALALVRRITSDIVAHAEKLVGVQEQLAAAKSRSDRASVEKLIDQRATIRDRLVEYMHELSELGVVLKDAEIGLVDFPALHRGRMVYLCWKLGEQAVAHWHEAGDGFADRRPVGDELTR